MYRSLCLVVLFAFAASVQGYGVEKPKIDPVVQSCQNLHGEILEVNGMAPNPERLLKNPETRCYAACILVGKKSLKSDGTLNTERLIEALPKSFGKRDQIIEALNACANEQGADICETAYKTVTCVDNQKVIREMGPEH